MSNLRQMGLATLMYSHDYDEMYPRAGLEGQPATPVAPGGWWSTAGIWFWPQLLYPYHKSIEAMKCPSSIVSGSPRWGNYGANRLVFPNTSGTSLHVAAVREPSRIYMFFDSSIYIMQPKEAYDPGGSYDKPTFLPGIGQAMNIPAPTDYRSYAKDYETGRHFTGISVAYTDGHVKWHPTEVVANEAKKYVRATSVSNWNPTTE